jgi:N-dimethylarginine dimethylaminohydrolase
MNINASRSQPGSPCYLMCPPNYFAVTYNINPWMDPGHWARNASGLHGIALRQWRDLVSTMLSAGARVHEMEPHPSLPDLVFTANAAVVLDRKALLARFRHVERRCEEPLDAALFQQMYASGLLDDLCLLPHDVILEGAGDCIWDPSRRLFWMGYGFRSDIRAAAAIQQTFGYSCLSLELTNPRFYHLDTAFCALPCGSVLYYPGAFSPLALEIIHSEIQYQHRIDLDDADAASFAANAVTLGNTIVLSGCSATLYSKLKERGYTVLETPLHAFLRSGGSACCLTLRLDHVSSAGRNIASSASDRA